MKKIKTLKIILIALISVFSISTANAQCTSLFTYTDNGGGNFSFTNTSTGSGLYSTWDFGDGNLAYTTNASNTYIANGAYNVCLTITDSISGCADTYCDSISVTIPCSGTVANFASNNVGATYTFISFSTGANLLYDWTFGDGNTASGISASNTYLTSGTYNVCLTITDSLSGCTDTHCNSISVTVGNPCSIAANFTYIDNGGGNLSFTNTSTGNYNFSNWDFGDGNTSSAVNPTHTYTTNGTYNVSLIINDSLCSDSVIQQITVIATPCNLNASFTYIDNGGGNYSFTNTSTGNYSFSNWDFGDGNTSSAVNPTHTYTTNSTYNVYLSLYDSLSQCSDSVFHQIIVTGAVPCSGAVANFTYTDNGNGNYSFTNTSTGSGTAYYWDFGDGNTSSAVNPTHTYFTNGFFPVQLVAYDSANPACQDAHIITIQVTGVSNPIQCNASFVITPVIANTVLVFNTSSGNNLTYFWDFGDGNTSTLAHPGYVYSTSGPFLLCLTVSDGNGCSSTYCDSIGSGGIVFKTGGFTINIQPPVTTGIEEDIESISELNVYPNPVKNNLTIELNLNEQTQVNVFITDLLGNKVAQINNEELNSGANTLRWNSNNLSNGIYLLNIETNNSLQVKKLVLNR